MRSKINLRSSDYCSQCSLIATVKQNGFLSYLKIENLWNVLVRIIKAKEEERKNLINNQKERFSTSGTQSLSGWV